MKAIITVVALCLYFLTSTTFAQDIKRGQEVVTKNCSRCHAVGRTGNSPHEGAPTFRTLSQRYEIDDLAEGLVEGFSSGHPDMPEFVYEVDDAAAILAYLKSIQEK